MLRQHGGSVVSTVNAQQNGPGFEPDQNTYTGLNAMDQFPQGDHLKIYSFVLYEMNMAIAVGVAPVKHEPASILIVLTFHSKHCFV